MSATTTQGDERDSRIERAMRVHFGFDCGPVYRVEAGLYAVGARGEFYETIHVNTASHADLLNGISLWSGYLLLRVKNQLGCVKLRA